MRKYLYDWTTQNITMGKIGSLYNFYRDEVVPGDTWYGKISQLVRFSPLKRVQLGNFIIDNFMFYVPHRIINQDWMDQVRRNPAAPNIPEISTKEDNRAIIGMPYKSSQTKELKVVAHPLRAYNKIWNDFFRDPETDEVGIDSSVGLWGRPCSNKYGLYSRLQKEVSTLDDESGLVPVKFGTGGIPRILQKSFYGSRPQGHYVLGYTTGNLKGGDILAVHFDEDRELHNAIAFSPAGSGGSYTQGTYVVNGQNTNSINYNSGNNKKWRDQVKEFYGINNGDIPTAGDIGQWNVFLDKYYTLYLVVGGTGSLLHIDEQGDDSIASIHVADIREAEGRERFARRAEMYGVDDENVETGYKNFLAMMGVKLPDSILDMPEMLAGSTCLVSNHDVVNTNLGSGEQPRMAGYAIKQDGFGLRKKYFAEHGTIMGVGIVRPQPIKAGGWNPYLDYAADIDDYFLPEYLTESYQQVKQKHISNPSRAGFDPEGFVGFHQKFDHYRIPQGKVHSGYTGSGFLWAQDDNDWENNNILSQEAADSLFADNENGHFQLISGCGFSVNRPIPTVGSLEQNRAMGGM